MPDVSRSDSQYSDSSRPRVSFNRDVHVKRFGAPSTPRVAGALKGDGERHHVPLAIHREDPSRLSRRELTEQAKRILADVDSVKCISQSLLDPKQKKSSTNSTKKFNTLPTLRNKRHRQSKVNHISAEESQSSPERSASREPHKHFKGLDNDSVEESSRISSEKDFSKVKGGKRFFVPSVFSSLDRSERKKNKQHAQNEHSASRLRKSKTNSSSLTDLTDASGRIAENKKRRHAVKRSISDVGTRKPDKYKKAGLFLSIDRLTARKSKNKSHSDYSDTSPAYPRKNILKKSHSDSESLPLHHSTQGDSHKKKQLSPIIEVTQKDDYFERNEKDLDLNSKKGENIKGSTEDAMLHSSQLPADKPALTRGHKVDYMVKKLSLEETHIRGPPRAAATAVLVTPEHRQHNNNLPFSYTEPTLQSESRSPTRDNLHRNTVLAKVPTATGDGQVIYAEVVVSGGGGALSKQTVHTKVPLSNTTAQEEPIHPNLHHRYSEDTRFHEPKTFTPQEHTVKVKVADTIHHTSDDEGLGLSMDQGAYRRSSLDYIKEGREYYNGGSSYKNRDNRLLNKNNDDDDYWYESSRKDFTEYDGNNVRKEYHIHESKHKASNHIISSSERGRADGMDSRKKDLLLSESYRPGRYDSVYNHNEDISSPKYRVRENYTTEFVSDSRIIPPDDDLSYRNFGGSTEKDILSHSIDSNDLSLRRHRLESRIESQMKDRFVNTKYNTEHSDTKINDSNRKHVSNINLNTRQDFLNSQVSSGRNSPYQDSIRQENVKNVAMKNSYSFASSRTHDFDSYNKKDLLADSGIEIDYRSKDPTVSTKRYENRIPSNEHLNAKTQTIHLKTVNKPSIDSYQHTDDEYQETDENYNNHNIVSHHKSSYHQKTKSANAFTSTQFIKEQKHSEAMPTSAVLIRHWAPSKDESPPPKHKHPASEKSNWKKDAPPSEEEYSDHEKTMVKEEIKQSSKGHKKLEEREKQSSSKEHKREEKKVQKKKPSSAMDKVKQLFSRSDKSAKKNKKKEEKVKVTVDKVIEEEDPLSRYTEYKGSNMELNEEHPRLSSGEKYQHESNGMETDQEKITKSSYKNKRTLEHGSPKSSPRDRAHYRSNTVLNDEHMQRVQHSPKVSHRRLKQTEEEDDEPRSSHRNYNGTNYHKASAGDHKEHKPDDYLQPPRQRLATPSPSPSPMPQRPYSKSTSATLNRINNSKNKEQNGGSWFKSLDRLGKRGKKIKEQETNDQYEDDPKLAQQNNVSNSSKNLRFFGDTDQESVSSAAQRSKHAALRRYKANTSTNGGSSHNRLKVPSRNAAPRHHRSVGDMATSSAESTTEGDSSQQSQRSVYLHAATVGDIPGPVKSRSGVGRRAQSREELSSTAGSSRLQPQTRTVSRSVSVLAPWKPRHYKEGLELHYSNNETNSKTLGRPSNGKPPKVPTAHHNSSSTMNRSSGASKYKNGGEKSKEDNSVQQKHAKKSMSVESLSQKNGQLQSQHSRSRTALDKKHINSAASVESLTHRRNRDRDSSSRNNSRMNNSTMEINSSGSRSASKKSSEGSSQRSSSKVSRSASMPKDSRSAGWFKLRNKKQGT